MATVEHYLEASERANTRRSYDSALRHFEVEWGGHLPATPDSVARYLAENANDNANDYAINTLKQRLAALAHWHHEHGFADPTRSTHVRKVLKGIQTLHRGVEKQAKPLQLVVLAQIAKWLDGALAAARTRADRGGELRCLRDRALVLLGFWRGFRGDELVRLYVENLRLIPTQGMTCFLQQSKGDRQNIGTTYKVPALSRWCPVTATAEWLEAAKLTQGPLFRRIDHRGHVAEGPLHANSLVPLLRRLFRSAGVGDAEAYSSHSLRRGFANWANANGWDIKALMEYVGWRDVKSAMRYLDAEDPFGQQRIERNLADAPAVAVPRLAAPSSSPALEVGLEVRINLTRFSPKARGLKKAHRLIEELCLAPHGAQRLDREGTHYRITIVADDDAALEETIAMMLDSMHRIADNYQCALNTSLRDESGNRHWD